MDAIPRVQEARPEIAADRVDQSVRVFAGFAFAGGMICAAGGEAPRMGLPATGQDDEQKSLNLSTSVQVHLYNAEYKLRST